MTRTVGTYSYLVYEFSSFLLFIGRFQLLKQNPNLTKIIYVTAIGYLCKRWESEKGRKPNTKKKKMYTHIRIRTIGGCIRLGMYWCNWYTCEGAHGGREELTRGVLYHADERRARGARNAAATAAAGQSASWCPVFIFSIIYCINLGRRFDIEMRGKGWAGLRGKMRTNDPVYRYNVRTYYILSPC